jgi:tRNA(Arg) A34 adenosine deaminase TadA
MRTSHHEEYMRFAIREAQRARDDGDYAIGAVITLNGEIISASGNRVKADRDATQHAEVAAIRLACRQLNSRHLAGCVLYTTHEPCPMCSAASVWSRLSGVVWGAVIEDMAEYRIKYATQELTWRTIGISAEQVLSAGDPIPWHVGGVLRDECRRLFHNS